MKTAILIVSALMLCAVFVACEEEAAGGDAGASSESTASTEPEATETPEAPPTIGTLVEVGDLDLTIHAAEAVDTTPYNMFNDANFQVRITATNARGNEDREYSLSPIAFKLVDDGGIAHDPAFGCAGCPDGLSSGVDLIRGGTFEGIVYFELPEGKHAVEIRYQPIMSSNKATIALQ